VKNQCYKYLHQLTKVTCGFLTIVVGCFPVQNASAQGRQTAVSPGLNRLFEIGPTSQIEYVRRLLQNDLTAGPDPQIARSASPGCFGSCLGVPLPFGGPRAQKYLES
jgi:hypothetical protein